MHRRQIADVNARINFVEATRPLPGIDHHIFIVKVEVNLVFITRACPNTSIYLLDDFYKTRKLGQKMRRDTYCGAARSGFCQGQILTSY